MDWNRFAIILICCVGAITGAICYIGYQIDKIVSKLDIIICRLGTKD